MNTPTSPTTITRKGTFADLLAGHVQRKCHGYASLAYNAAWINRRTWSAIVTNPHRPVAKRTAIQFALALRLSRAEADELLRAAGYALSPSIIDDVIFASCIDEDHSTGLAAILPEGTVCVNRQYQRSLEKWHGQPESNRHLWIWNPGHSLYTMSVDKLEVRTGFEPVYAVLQTAT